MFFEISLMTAVIVTILGIVYLATIGRLTDVIPIIGFGDDVVVVLIIVLIWMLVFLSTMLENPLVWGAGIIIVLAVLEYKIKFVSGFIKNVRK